MFQAGVLLATGRTFTFNITIDRLTTFHIVSELLSVFGASVQAGDIINIVIDSGVNVISASTGFYAIDGDGLEGKGTLVITMSGTASVRGKGGVGGGGGDVVEGPGGAGFVLRSGAAGAAGGHAIRLGCKTILLGIGFIVKGFAGGEGGDATGTGGVESAGSGGGGGAALGLGGEGGEVIAPAASGPDGQDGGDATATTAGSGGGGAGATAGEDGGDTTDPAGGANGGDGDAIHKQGFELVDQSLIVITGTIV